MKQLMLHLSLLVIVTKLSPITRGQEVNLQAPPFPVYAIYQLATTNNVTKYDFGAFTNDCPPLNRMYLTWNVTLDYSDSFTQIGTGTLASESGSGTYHVTTSDTFQADPTTFTYNDCPPLEWPCSAPDSYSGAASGSVITTWSTNTCSCTRTNLDEDWNTCSGYKTEFSDWTSTNCQLISPSKIICSNYYYASNFFDYGDGDTWTKIDTATSVSTQNLDSEFQTVDLINWPNINFTDPTWYQWGDAETDLSDDGSEQCAYFLQKMRYMLVFIAPAGKPFSFQYDERFLPADPAASSWITKIVTVTGVGTGTWQTWPSGNPVETDQPYYTVTSGGCTFTRGGATVVEIPGAAGGGSGGGGGGSGGCPSCQCSGFLVPGFSAANSSIDIKVRLGNGQYGSSKGYLVVAESTNSAPQLFTPATLHYLGGFTNTTDFKIIDDSSGNLRQVKTPQVLADIVTDSNIKYEIRLYTASGSMGTNDLYQPSPGNLFSTGIIEEINSSTNDLQFTVIDDVNNTTNIYEYVWSPTNHGWTLTSGGGLRVESIGWDSTGSIKTNIIQDGSGHPVYEKTTSYINLPSLGQVQSQQVVDPAGAALTTQWFYYTNSSTDGTNYGRLKMAIQPSGFWQAYQYDSNANLTKVTSQFLNCPTNSADSLCRVINYSYTNVGSALYSETVVETLLGQEVSRTYYLTFPSEMQTIQCQTPGAAWNAANNLVTTTMYVPSGTYVGKIQSVLNPDGTMTTYQYSNDGTYQTTIMSAGQPGPYQTNIIGGTQTTTVVDQLGAIVSSKTLDIASGITLSDDEYGSRDYLDRPGQVSHLDGTTDAATYACCGIETSVGRDGTLTKYTYDALKRPITSAVQIDSSYDMITTSNVLDAGGSVLATVRIGTDNSQIVQSQTAYDLAGRVVLQTNALNGVTTTTNTFDSDGQTVVTNIYPDGGTQVSTYAQDGSLLSIVGTAVRPISYIYGVDSNGTFTTTVKLTATGGTNEWIKTYQDMLGRPYKTVYSGAVSNPFSISYFNNLGQLTNQVDPDGVSTLYVYNGKGEQAYSVTDVNRNGSIDWSGPDRITFITTDVTSDNGANVSRTRTFVWGANSNSSNLLSTVETSVEGLTNWNTLWNSGAAVTTTNITAYYPGSGMRVGTAVSPDGSLAVSTNRYGQLISTTQYDSGGNQLGNTIYGHDAHGRQSTVTDARNGTTTYYFSSADQLSGAIAPPAVGGGTGQITTNIFDNMGRVITITQPDGTVVYNAYYVTGDLALTYGSRTYPVGYGYDAQGRKQTMTNWSDFSGNSGTRVTTWTYDSYRGFLTSKTYDGGASGPSYTYTSAGRLASRLWARGTNTTYSYDSAGGLATVIYNDGSTPGITNGYDRRGRQTTVSNGPTICTFTYDDQSDRLSESYAGGSLNGLIVTNIYDSLLRRTTNGLWNGNSWLTQTRYSYDGASRLSTVSDGTNTAGYSYVANSPLIGQIAFTNAGSLRMTTTKSYDYLNRLTNIGSVNASSVVLDSHSYVYNNANQRAGVTNADGTHWIYQYDALGQMISGVKYWPDNSVVAGQQFGYAFDDIGNRTGTSAGGDHWGANLRYANYSANSLNQYTSRTVPGAVDIVGVATNNATVTVNNEPTYRKGTYYRTQLPLNNGSSAVYQSVTNLAALNRGGTNQDILTNITGNVFLPQNPENFTYDADGNLTQDGRWTFSWDAENRLINVTSLSGAPSASKSELSFTYDWKGRRIEKLVSTNNGIGYVASYTNAFAYDDWNLLAEINDANSALVRNYIWGADLSGTTAGAGGIGGLLAISSGAAVQFVLFDGNGNVSSLADARDGTSVAQYEYGPFGELIRSTGRASAAIPYRFSTKYQDIETDFSYYGHRYYSQKVGRWISRDPINEKGGLNLYLCANNDLSDNFDSLGCDSSQNPCLPEWPSDPLTLYPQIASYDSSCCNKGPNGQTIPSQNELVRRFTLLRTHLDSVVKTLDGTGNSGPSCFQVNHAILYAMQPMPKCWLCFMDRHNDHLGGLGTDENFIHCFAVKNWLGNQIVFDYFDHRYRKNSGVWINSQINQFYNQHPYAASRYPSLFPQVRDCSKRDFNWQPNYTSLDQDLNLSSYGW